MTDLLYILRSVRDVIQNADLGQLEAIVGKTAAKEETIDGHPHPLQTLEALPLPVAPTTTHGQTDGQTMVSCVCLAIDQCLPPDCKGRAWSSAKFNLRGF